MAIERAKATRRRTCLQAGATRRTAEGEFLVPRGMTLSERQGKKVASPPLRLRRSRRSRPSARSSHKRGCVGRVGSDSIFNKEIWRGSDHPRKKSGVRGEGKEAIACRKAAATLPNRSRTALASPSIVVSFSPTRAAARSRRARKRRRLLQSCTIIRGLFDARFETSRLRFSSGALRRSRPQGSRLAAMASVG